MDSSEKLCLQWNEFKENITFLFKELRNDKDFTDVTLACEDGQHVAAHRTVLASSSPFFMELLKKHKHPHPLIYMRGIKSKDLVTIMDFLYFGQANVLQDNLDSFLALAEELNLKGLSGSSQTDEDPHQLEPQKRSECLSRKSLEKIQLIIFLRRSQKNALKLNIPREALVTKQLR